MDFLIKALDELKTANNYRELRIIQSAQVPRVIVDGKEFIMLASSSYLGLNTHPKLIAAAKAAVSEFGVGSSGSRLITGNLSLHESLEYALTRFLGTSDTILFNSGYDANIGTISALMKGTDIIFSDELNHASIIDGCHLSKAKVSVYEHNNMEDLEQKLRSAKSDANKYDNRFIITDTVFSMDGDLANLKRLVELASEYDAYVMVDEAHAFGVFGNHGRGLSEHFGLEKEIDIKMGALSKAFGTSGGFISGSEELVDYLRNRARSFVYTTSLPPAVLGSSIAAVELVRSEPELREQLWRNIDYWRSSLIKAGLNTMSSASQIIPILIGPADKTMAFSQYLFDHGIFVSGIRPPTVPAGKCRLRTTMMANHSENDLKNALDIFQNAKDAIGF